MPDPTPSYRPLLRLVALALLLAATRVQAQAPATHVVLIGGLGGEPAYTERFGQYLFETRQAFTDALGVPASQISVLAEPALEAEAYVDGLSTAEGIRAHFAALAARVTEADQVYVILFGHGSYDGTEARLNIPRRDLSATDYAALVDGLGAGRVVFVHTGSASAPFIDALSGPGRVVITATRTGTQRNETRFPIHFIDALTTPDADRDKNGDLTVAEVFAYAALRTSQTFEEEAILATEHALLDDDGDGVGHRMEEVEAAGEGHLAALVLLGRRALPETTLPPAELATRLNEQAQLEGQIAALKGQKSTLREGDYYAQLEVLFIRLARLNDRIEAGQ